MFNRRTKFLVFCVVFFCFFLFFFFVFFFHEDSRITGLLRKGEGISLTPH